METDHNIADLNAGSYEAFKCLYDRYYAKLYGFVYGVTRSRSMTEDVVQETFMKVWIHRGQIRPGTSFQSYLFKISRNRVVDLVRKRINHPLFEDYLEYCEQAAGPDAPNPVESQVDFELFTERLQAAKAKLTDRQRQIFELSKEQGFSSAEIASMLAISEQTIYNQLSSIMHALRKSLAGALLVLLFLGN